MFIQYAVYSVIRVINTEIIHDLFTLKFRVIWNSSELDLPTQNPHNAPNNLQKRRILTLRYVMSRAVLIIIIYDRPNSVTTFHRDHLCVSVEYADV